MEDIPINETTKRIEIRMAEVGVRTIADLGRIAGMNRTSLSQKFNGSRKWRLFDLQKIATALHTSASYLMGEQDDPSVSGELNAFVTLPVAELERRLNLLGISLWSVVMPGRSCEKCDGGKTLVCVSRAQMEQLALEEQVPTDYFLDCSDPVAAERVEAKIDLALATRELGLKSVSVRAMGTLPPEVYRAFARVVEDYAARNGRPAAAHSETR